MHNAAPRRAQSAKWGLRLGVAGALVEAAHLRVGVAVVVAARAPEVIIASWCGKKASYARIAGRSAFSEVPAVLHDRLYEVKSTFILQPGPAALTDGLAQLERIIAEVAHDTRDTSVKPRTLRAFRPPVWDDASEADASEADA